MASDAKRVIISVSSKSPYWSEAWESSFEVCQVALELIEKSKLISFDTGELPKSKFLVKERWNVRTFVVFDIFHDAYDPDEAHLPGHNDLPVIVVYLGQKTSTSVASSLVEGEVNRRVREIHDVTGLGSRPPFSIDHMDGNVPCYTNPRTKVASS